MEQNVNAIDLYMNPNSPTEIKNNLANVNDIDLGLNPNRPAGYDCRPVM